MFNMISNTLLLVYSLASPVSFIVRSHVRLNVDLCILEIIIIFLIRITRRNVNVAEIIKFLTQSETSFNSKFCSSSVCSLLNQTEKFISPLLLIMGNPIEFSIQNVVLFDHIFKVFYIYFK